MGIALGLLLGPFLPTLWSLRGHRRPLQPSPDTDWKRDVFDYVLAGGEPALRELAAACGREPSAFVLALMQARTLGQAPGPELLPPPLHRPGVVGCAVEGRHPDTVSYTHLRAHET